MVFSSRLCVGTERSQCLIWRTPCVKHWTIVRNSHNSSGRARMVQLFHQQTSGYTTTSTSQCSLPLLSHWPWERYHTCHYAKRKSDFPLMPLHKRLDLWLEAVYHLPPEIGKKHLHLIILHWHSWVLSAQELSFTGSIIILCNRSLGLETQVYNRLPDLQTGVWGFNYQFLY